MKSNKQVLDMDTLNQVAGGATITLQIDTPVWDQVQSDLAADGSVSFGDGRYAGSGVGQRFLVTVTP